MVVVIAVVEVTAPMAPVVVNGLRFKAKLEAEVPERRDSGQTTEDIEYVATENRPNSILMQFFMSSNVPLTKSKSWMCQEGSEGHLDTINSIGL